MAVFRVQHGKSLSKETDPDCGLSEQGKKDTARIADMAKHYGISVSRIYHSGKKRALQTAEIFASALDPEGGILERRGLNPLDNAAELADNIAAQDNLMIVGHLPFMENLTSYLITRSFDRKIFKFQNSGILCLDKDPDTQAWFIKWSLMPNIL